jgi:hypothetical protein
MKLWLVNRKQKRLGALPQDLEDPLGNQIGGRQIDHKEIIDPQLEISQGLVEIQEQEGKLIIDVICAIWSGIVTFIVDSTQANRRKKKNVLNVRVATCRFASSRIPRNSNLKARWLK